jgi:hypothetical protein
VPWCESCATSLLKHSLLGSIPSPFKVCNCIQASSVRLSFKALSIFSCNKRGDLVLSMLKAGPIGLFPAGLTFSGRAAGSPDAFEANFTCAFCCNHNNESATRNRHNSKRAYSEIHALNCFWALKWQKHTF